VVTGVVVGAGAEPVASAALDAIGEACAAPWVGAALGAPEQAATKAMTRMRVSRRIEGLLPKCLGRHLIGRLGIGVRDQQPVTREVMPTVERTRDIGGRGVLASTSARSGTTRPPEA
jgi:hypothetical protein